MAQILSMGNNGPAVPAENPLRIVLEKFRNTSRFFKIQILSLALIMLVIPVIAGKTLVDNRSRASAPVINTTYDLKSYYPNPDMFKNYYLEGKNYNNNSRSVLWFEPQDQYSFKLYNSAPDDPIYARCNYDILSWWDDGFLRYPKTHNDCPGNTPNDIVYDPPIIFLPKVWNSTTPWSYTGQSSATYLENGVVKCTGTINYTGNILGIEQIAPNEPGIHWNTVQTTTWTFGNVPGKCAAGYTTHWQEDYWLTGSLPVQGGSTAKGLKRGKGGNTDITTDNWDVWFDKWNPLPGAPTPSVNPTPTLKPTSTPTSTPIATLKPTPTPSPTPAVDRTAPIVSITNPKNGSFVNRNSLVNITANATDNVEISKVVFFVNGSQKCSDSLSPYTCNWTVPNIINANYTISSYAYDTSGNISSAFVGAKAK